MIDGLRKALYCLLLIALPLQAFAGGGMQHCTSMQLRLSLSTAAHSIGESASFKNEAAGAVQQESSSTADKGCGDPAQGNRSSDRSAGQCGATTGCGIVAAFVPALPVLMQLPADGAPAVSQAGPHIGFLTDAPERPPRTIA